VQPDVYLQHDLVMCLSVEYSSLSKRRARCRFTKLRLWEWQDEFDLLLYLDADTLARGRIEAVLDHFAPNGTAPRPLGAAGGTQRGGQVFNAGVMAIQPSRAVFAAMLKAGRTMEYPTKFAEQDFLNFYLSREWGWTRLPQTCNLISTFFLTDSPVFKRSFPRALLLHFVSLPKVRLCSSPRCVAADSCGRDRFATCWTRQTHDATCWTRQTHTSILLAKGNGRMPYFEHRPGTLPCRLRARAPLQIMMGRVTLDDSGRRIVATSDGERKHVLNALWIDAWTESRRLLQLPVPPRVNVTVADIFTAPV
jgi:hypothetical protein